MLIYCNYCGRTTSYGGKHPPMTCGNKECLEKHLHKEPTLSDELLVRIKRKQEKEEEFPYKDVIRGKSF